LPPSSKQARFEEAVLPHLGAAYNLARWLTRDDHDAEDAVQEAYLRAFKSFDHYRGGDGRAWLLAVVRTTCYTWLEKHRGRGPAVPFDEEAHAPAAGTSDPEAALLRRASVELVRDAIAELPPAQREVVVLRELEGFSYKDIAAIAAIPLGTVMSRLARGRERLGECLSRRLGEELGP
jgi:RNA polymerase sigma-70 factor (ECF subfamily)